jgi:uncharacterized membrane protein
MLAAALSAMVALVSFRYLLPSAPGTPPNVAGNLLAWPLLPVHAVFGATALLLGATQFWPRLRARRPGLHRLSGRVYVMACLVGGASGFGLALGSTAGPVAAAGFGMLGLAWIYATVLAWRRAVQGRLDEHRRWMVRSFALTFAAVTLRLQLPLAAAVPIDPLDAYRAIAWLCWVPNLLAVEAFLALGAPRFLLLEKP